MKIQIDLKSATIGLLVGAAAMFTLGNATEQNQNGRYQAVMTGYGPNNIESMIVDTQTGQVWNAPHDGLDKFFAPKQ